MNYRNLEVWRLARELVIAIYNMTLTKLPKFEMFEEGSADSPFDQVSKVQRCRRLSTSPIQTGVC